MSSVVASGLFNAVAFAVAGFLFSSFNKNGYEDEIKRQNLAVEELTKARGNFKEKK